MALFGPTTGTTADNVRDFARYSLRLRYNKNERHRNLTPDEVEKYVKVAQVVRFHGHGTKVGYGIYEEVSLFGRSCDSNINYVIENKVARCYAKRSIQAGDRMTIPCKPGTDLMPTHERRYKFLEWKEFTCHCPRCDALGDDTRQFDCCNPTCPGVMMAHQPLNKREIRQTDVPYTGVEYVEPHLLPCTVCHRRASAHYEAQLFQAEDNLPFIEVAVLHHLESKKGVQRPQELANMLNILSANKVARHHAAMLNLLRLEIRIMHQLCQSMNYPALAVQEVVQNYISSYEYLFPRGNIEMLADLTSLALTCCSGLAAPVLSPLQEKELCLKALRMRLLFKGRNNRDADLDDATARVLWKFPPVVHSEVCAFCEESPQHAAMKRSRCGQCKQVVYCSSGCQKAHWPLHKKTCKAQENK